MYRFRCISTTKPIVGTSTCPIPGTGSIGRRSMCSWPCTRRWSDSQCNVCSCQKTNSTGFITVSGNIWEYMFLYALILFHFGLSYRVIKCLCTSHRYIYKIYIHICLPIHLILSIWCLGKQWCSYREPVPTSKRGL